MKQVIFGLFLSSDRQNKLLGIMEENVFLSKSREQLETLCILLSIAEDIQIGSKYVCPFDIKTMKWTLSGNKESATIEFRELNVIN